MANVDRATQGQVDSMPPHPQTESSKLEDQAATAALYNKSQPEPKPKPGDRYPLDEHHKLSAAGECEWEFCEVGLVGFAYDGGLQERQLP